MADDPGELGHDHPKILSPLGDLNTHQLLHRQHIAQVVGHGADVVQPVGERDVHNVGVALADLLVTSVEVPHLGLESHHVFALDRDDHAEHTMR